MDSKSTAEFDFSDNPELAALFATKKPGDKVTLEVEFIVKESDQNRATATIKSICDCSAEDMDEEEIKPDGSSPVMMVFGSK